jgi:hypothetical protein
VRARGIVIVLAGLLAAAGCGATSGEPSKPADNTAALCARWKDSTLAFMGRENLAPEAQAYNQAIQDQYVGKQRPEAELIEIQRAYWSAQEAVPRGLAAEATDPRLRAALSAYADELRSRAEGQALAAGGIMNSPALTTLMALCQGSSLPPS